MDSNNGGSAGQQCLYGCSSAESPLAIQFLHHPPTDEGTMMKMTMTAATTTTTATATATYWCRGHILHAAALHFVLRQFFCAVALCFVLRQCSSCSSKKMMHCSVAWHFAPWFLCASARSDPLLHSAACHVMRRHYCSSRGQVCCAAVLFTARNDVPQHAMLLFFVLQQETTCCCVP